MPYTPRWATLFISQSLLFNNVDQESRTTMLRTGTGPWINLHCLHRATKTYLKIYVYIYIYWLAAYFILKNDHFCSHLFSACYSVAVLFFFFYMLANLQANTNKKRKKPNELKTWFFLTNLSESLLWNWSAMQKKSENCWWPARKFAKVTDFIFLNRQNMGKLCFW